MAPHATIFGSETKMTYEIWDNHTHLIESFGDTPEARLGKMLKYADRMGISRICLFAGIWEGTYNLSPDQLRAANDTILRAVKAYPDRAFGYVYLNPKHTQASLEEMNRCIRDGPMVGVKLLAAEHCNKPTLDPIIERAMELKAPVLQHTWLKITGNLPDESTPMELAELAARHPAATLICGHSGGDWEQGIRAIRPHPNVCADLCGGDPTSGFTEMAVRELGAERVLYGSDVGGRSFASQLGKVLGADIPESAKRLILAGNLKRLLKPILDAKGVKL
jgi:predicted TIM-barrel fold metal-dependent hydrolase